MSRRLIQLTKNLVKPEQPLFCPIYKEDGTLLVQKGIVLSVEQVLTLSRHETLYTYAKDLIRHEPGERKARRHRARDRYDMNYHMRSPLSRLEELKDLLLKVYQRPHDRRALEDILLIIERIRLICDEDPDVAIATLFIDSTENYTASHAIHVAILSNLMAEFLDWSESHVCAIVGAALTMNIAMGIIQDELQSQAKPLTIQQKSLIRKHPINSYKMLAEMGVSDKHWLEYVAKHHESLDGSGYPRGISAEQIPLGASMLHLADVYCAKVTGRQYREPILANVAARDVFKDKDTKSQGNLIEIFLKILGIYPPGLMVKLASGELAVVIKRGERVDTPQVRSLIDIRGKIIMSAVPRNTANKSNSVEEVVFPNRVKDYVNYSSLWGYTSK